MEATGPLEGVGNERFGDLMTDELVETDLFTCMPQGVGDEL